MKKVLVTHGHISATEPYEAAVRLAGMEPFLSPPDDALSLTGFSGLLLTGGDDVNPEYYGEKPIAETEPPDTHRDAFELRLISEALERDLPIFGICRGLQILNVQHGGSLIQHISSVERHRRRTPNRALPAHSVAIRQRTLLADIAGLETWQVNSRHHQAVAKLGKGLLISATDSEDNAIVEALERPDKRFVLAVQWHPEDQALSGPEQLRLFQRFAEVL